LFFLINNEYEALETIEEYELYGDKLEKLFKLCNDDEKLINYSLKVIKNYYYITKEIVDINFNLEEPIPFIENFQKPALNIEQLYISLQGATFKQKFKKATQPEYLNKIENFFKNK